MIVLLEGHKLRFSELQFAYKTSSSTSTCSWAVSAVIERFNREGCPVYGAAMDMTKAFAMVEWSKMFSVLIKRKVDFIFLRLMLFIYVNQKCRVDWSGKQGALKPGSVGTLLPGNLLSHRIFEVK